MRLQLLPSASADAAIQALENAAREYDNRSSQGHDARSRRDVYFQWADSMVGNMRQHFGLESAEKLVHSDFYWFAVSINTEDHRASGMLEQGIRLEAEKLHESAKVLRTMSAVLTSPADWQTAVVDTNALSLMHPPWDVNWPEMLHAARVRVLIPLRVIEELDKRKYDNNERSITRVARSLLPQLEAKLDELNGTKHTVSESLTIEVPVLPGPREHVLHADEEILQLCQQVSQFSIGKSTLVTDDTSMRIQARARGVDSVGIANSYRRKPSAHDPSER